MKQASHSSSSTFEVAPSEAFSLHIATSAVDPSSQQSRLSFNAEADLHDNMSLISQSQQQHNDIHNMVIHCETHFVAASQQASPAPTLHSVAASQIARPFEIKICPEISQPSQAAANHVQESLSAGCQPSSFLNWFDIAAETSNALAETSYDPPSDDLEETPIQRRRKLYQHLGCFS